MKFVLSHWRKLLFSALCFLVFGGLSLDTFSQNRSHLINKKLFFEHRLEAEVVSQDSGKLNYLYGRFLYFPREENGQKILSVDNYSMPEADSISPDKSYLEWKTLQDKYYFAYHAFLMNETYLPKIKDEPFPKKIIKPNFERYLKFDSFVDSSEILSIIATIFTEDEHTLLSAATSVANFVNGRFERQRSEQSYSITYPPSTTIDKTQAQSIEFATLFMSLMRCVNIPVRYVAGMAFFDNKMQQHAWAEVFFEESGWIPFDPMLGQYGFIDASHIKLKAHYTIPDILRHEWRYYPYFGDVNIPLEQTPLIEATVIGEEMKPLSPVDISIDALANEVSHDSKVPIIVTVRNKNNFSISDKITVPLRNFIDLKGNEEQVVTLKPYEEIQLNYTVELEKGFNNNVNYHVFMKASDQFGTVDSVLVSFEPEGKQFSEEECVAIMDTLSMFQGFNASDILFETKALKKYYFTNETPSFCSHIQNLKDSGKHSINVISAIGKGFEYNLHKKANDTIPTHLNERYIFPCLKDKGRMVCRPVVFNRIKQPKLFFELIEFKPANEKRKMQIRFEIFAIGHLKDVTITFNKKDMIILDEIEGEISELITLPDRLKLRPRIRFKVAYTGADGTQYEHIYFKRILTLN